MSRASLEAVSKKGDRDEYYTTQLAVDDALQHLPPGSLAGKHVHLPCNDGMDSAFTRYFIKHFTRLELARLTALSYCPPQTSYLDTAPREPARLYSQCRNSSSLVDVRGSGGWQSELGHSLIEEADAIFTNPPFSMLSPFIKAIAGKEFAIIAPKTSIIYPTVYPLLYRGKAVAYRQEKSICKKSFVRPTGELAPVGYMWLSTFALKPTPLPPGLQWSADIADDYPLLEPPLDFARNVNSKYAIPRGYNGWLAVPINVMLYDLTEWVLYHNTPSNIILNGKHLFRRILIKERRSSDAHSSVDSLCPSHRTIPLF